VVTLDAAKAALRVYDVDDLGLDRLDKAVLAALVETFGGGPVGLSTLAVAVGEQPETVAEVCEPFLVRAGLLARTPRGRVATPAAWQHLGRTPPNHVFPGQTGTQLPGQTAGNGMFSGGAAGAPDLFSTTDEAE
jgi:holliday junction DNA helicase RuvB